MNAAADDHRSVAVGRLRAWLGLAVTTPVILRLASSSHLEATPTFPLPVASATLAVVVVSLGPLLGLLRREPGPSAASLCLPFTLLALAVPPAVTGSAWAVAVSLPSALVVLWSMALAAQVATLPPAAAGVLITRRLVAVLGLAVALYPGLGPNERSGALAPLVVWLLAGWAAAPWPAGRWRRLESSLGLVLASMLALTIRGLGSRGGMLALAVGLATVVVLGPTTGRRRLRRAAWMGVAVLVLTWWQGHSVIERWLFDGSPQGWRWDVVLTGRPQIWERALAMIADQPATGIGLAMFGRAARSVYALPLGSGPLEDAHSLPLQVWLDFGFLGVIAFVLLVLVAVRAAVHRLKGAEGGPARWWAIGLAGALAATAVFNLGDALAPGTVAGIGTWLLLGALVATSGSEVPQAVGRRAIGVRPVVTALMLIGLVAALVPALRHGVGRTLALDRAAGEAVRAVVRDDRSALRRVRAPLAELGTEVCRARWLEGRVRNALDDARRDDAWLALASCAPGRIGMMSLVAPHDFDLAAAVVDRQPPAAAAYLWLARAYLPRSGARPTPSERRAAIRAFRRGLALDPRDGYGWRQLGDLLVDDEPWAALAAYAGSCRHGDPGANGCLLAGATAEDLGEVALAETYFAASRWDPARARAEALRIRREGP